MSDLWIFAYGSLMWRPGFAYAEARSATLTGYRRCFCMYSVHHRGTPSRPGLVLGLDRGGVCHGLAYRIAAAHARETLAYLRAREQVTGAYREAALPLQLGPDDHVSGIGYIAERAHPGYAGQLALRDQAHLIRRARGISGANLDYLVNTLHHLATLGIRERELERILVAASPVFGQGTELSRGARIAALIAATSTISVGPAQRRSGDLRRFLHRQASKTGAPLTSTRG
jgi:glutathione-specific gamma-glutamylcyclotransferase